MLEKQREIDVYQSRRFEKVVRKLPEPQLKTVEDEIDNIIENPEIGELKKGDLSHLRVHKFKINNEQVLLGYSWLESKIEIYLLYLGAHENFYKKMKEQRKIDVKFIKT